MDEGFLTDSKGRKVRFDNIFLFMTTNLGMHKEQLGFMGNGLEKNSELEEFLGVEFLNRIEKIYYFNKMTENFIHKIVENKLNILKEAFKKKDIAVNFSKEIVDKVIENSQYEKFGARRVDKVIDEVVTSLIVDAWFNGKKEIVV